MKRISSIVMLVVFCMSLIFACSPPEPTAEETRMMEALKKIQTGVDNKISLEEYGKLLDDAKQKLAALKGMENSNDCFLNAVSKACQFYDLCKDAWQKKESAKDEKTRSDMDMTLTFTLGFASVSLAQAQECFEPK